MGKGSHLAHYLQILVSLKYEENVPHHIIDILDYIPEIQCVGFGPLPLEKYIYKDLIGFFKSIDKLN